MTPEERCLAALAELGRRGVDPFDDQGWMNPEDKAAVVAPFALAIREAVAAERERIAAMVEAFAPAATAIRNFGAALGAAVAPPPDEP